MLSAAIYAGRNNNSSTRAKQSVDRLIPEFCARSVRIVDPIVASIASYKCKNTHMELFWRPTVYKPRLVALYCKLCTLLLVSLDPEKEAHFGYEYEPPNGPHISGPRDVR